MSRCQNRRKGGSPRKRGKKGAPKAKWAVKGAAAVQAMPAPLCSPSIDIPVMVLSAAAVKKIVDFVEGDPNHECGAFLIGNLCKDRVTGVCIGFVEDIYTDGDYGSGSDYEFTVDTQIRCLSYVERNYDGRMHVIGTVHSHANYPAFYSGTDYRMMGSRMMDEMHMVISPRFGEYVLTYKNKETVYNHSVALQTDAKAFRYARKTIQERDGCAYRSS